MSAESAASPPDRHGYFSLGVSADYTSSFIGRARVFLEVTEDMPRTFGRNQLHVSQLAGWCEADYPLVEVPPVEPNDLDHRIAEELDHVVRKLEHLGGVLAANPMLLNRHPAEL